MIALKFFILCATLMLLVLLSTKIATHHYKTYKGDDPLYIIYGMCAVIIWGTIMIFVFGNNLR